MRVSPLRLTRLHGLPNPQIRTSTLVFRVSDGTTGRAREYPVDAVSKLVGPPPPPVSAPPAAAYSSRSLRRRRRRHARSVGLGLRSAPSRRRRRRPSLYIRSWLISLTTSEEEGKGTDEDRKRKEKKKRKYVS